MTGGQIVYGLEYLEIYPDYYCYDIRTNEWDSCDRETDICDKNLPRDQWQINYNSSKSYHNWVDPAKLDLTCTHGSLIGSMGSAYFLGFAISSAIMPPLSDRYGRKNPYLGSLIFQTFAHILIV